MPPSHTQVHHTTTLKNCIPTVGRDLISGENSWRTVEPTTAAGIAPRLLLTFYHLTSNYYSQQPKTAYSRFAGGRMSLLTILKFRANYF